MRATTKMHSMRQVYKYAKYVRQLGRENEMGNGNTNEMIFPNFSPKTVLSTCCRCIAWASAADNFVFIVQFFFESVSNRVIAEIVTRVKKKKKQIEK